MVDGGDNIKEATWESVSSMLQVVSVMIKLRHKQQICAAPLPPFIVKYCNILMIFKITHKPAQLHIFS